MSPLKAMAERADRSRSVMEREPRPAPPEREGRVVREAEWLNPALGRKAPEDRR